LLFTNLGNYIFLPVYKIDEQKWKDLGVYVNNIVPIEKDEFIIKAISVSSFDSDETLLLATKDGMMKQAKLKEFEVSRYNKPLKCMKLSKGDELVYVDQTERKNIIAISKRGYTLRFKTEELPLYGLQAGGVKCMSLSEHDAVVSALYVGSGDEFVILTNRGHVIKDVVDELPIYNRNRRGILIIDHQKANPHYAVSASRLSRAQNKENASVRIIAEKEALILTVSDLKYSGNKFGKKIFEESNLGSGLMIEIFKVYEPEDELKPKTMIKKPLPVIDTKDIVKEEVIEVSDKKIHLNRFDLFDEED
jgi:topoisomerase-4 subunit A